MQQHLFLTEKPVFNGNFLARNLIIIPSLKDYFLGSRSLHRNLFIRAFWETQRDVTSSKSRGGDAGGVASEYGMRAKKALPQKMLLKDFRQ